MSTVAPATTTRPPRALQVIAAVAGLALLVAAATVTFVDAEVYRAAVRALLDGQPLYHVTGAGSLLPFTYPPFAAVALVPVFAGGQVAGQVLLTALSLACLVRTWQLLLRHTDLDPSWAVPAALVSLALQPVWSTLFFGQVNLILLWLVVEDLLGPPRRGRGLLTGVAAAVKLTPAIFLLAVALRREKATCVRLVAGFLGASVLGSLVQPDSAREYWTDLVWQPAHVGGVDFVGNQSLLGLLARLGTTATPLYMVTAGVVSVLVLLLVQRRRDDELVTVSTVAVLMLLVSPISWTHHWVWALPMLAVLLRERATRGARWLLTAAVVVFVGWPLFVAVSWLHGPTSVLYLAWAAACLVWLSLYPWKAAYYAAPERHAGCVADAQRCNQTALAPAPCHRTPLVPLATAPLHGYRLSAPSTQSVRRDATAPRTSDMAAQAARW